jgi:hypothetical protein
MSRTQTVMVIAGVAVAIILIAVVGILKATQGSGGGGSSIDPELKQTADRILPQINHVHGKLQITDASLTSFQAWVYDSETVLTGLSRAQRSAQFEQLQFTDPSTLPPQTPVFSLPGHAVVSVDAGVVSHVVQTQQPEYATVHQASGPDLRVYVAPLTTPSLLTPAQCTGVLEVVQQES